MIDIDKMAFFRACGITFLPEEGAGWFPGDELKEFYELGEYKDSKLESIFLGHRGDGREGLICSTIPPYVREANKLNSNSEDEDEEQGIGITINSASNSKK